MALVRLCSGWLTWLVRNTARMSSPARIRIAQRPALASDRIDWSIDSAWLAILSRYRVVNPVRRPCISAAIGSACSWAVDSACRGS